MRLVCTGSHLLFPNSHYFPYLPSLHLGSHKTVLYVCESVSVPQTWSSVSCFRSHIEAISYDICLSADFAQYDNLMLLQIVSFHSFEWLSNTPLCVLFICHQTLRLFLFFGYCEWCCYDHNCTSIFLNLWFCLDICPGVRLLDHMCVLIAQSSPTLCNPMDCSPPGSSVCGITQAKILEWVAISFSRGSSLPRDRTQVSYIAGRLFTI